MQINGHRREKNKCTDKNSSVKSWQRITLSLPLWALRETLLANGDILRKEFFLLSLNYKNTIIWHPYGTRNVTIKVFSHTYSIFTGVRQDLRKHKCIQDLREKMELYDIFRISITFIMVIFLEDEIPLLTRLIITAWDLCDGNSALNPGKLVTYLSVNLGLFIGCCISPE